MSGLTPLTDYNYQFLLLSEYLKDRVVEEERHQESVKKLAMDDDNFKAYLETLKEDQTVMALLQQLCVKDYSCHLTDDARDKCIKQLEREAAGAEAAKELEVTKEIPLLVRRLKQSKNKNN